MANILVVEDDPLIRELVRTVLERGDHVIAEAASLAVAHPHLDRGETNLVLADLGLPDGDGDDIIRRVLHEGKAKVIAMTGRARTTTLPVHASLRKPIPLGELVALVEQLSRGLAPAGPPRTTEPAELLNERITALAGVSEALARAMPDELPIRAVLQRYLDAPGVDLAAIYRHDTGGMPRLVMAALTQDVPEGQLASFFGYADLLAAADVTDDILIDLCSDEGDVARVLELSGMGRIVVAPLVYARRCIGVLALGFGGRTGSQAIPFVRAVQSQLTLLMRLAETQEDTEIQLIGGESRVEHFRP